MALQIGKVVRKLYCMSATVVREKRQTTLPEDACQAAGIKVNDQVEWRGTPGEIHGKVLRPAKSKVITHVMKLVKKDGWLVWDNPDRLEIPPESIVAAIHAEREEP